MLRVLGICCGALALTACAIDQPPARVVLSEAAVVDGGSYSTGGGLTLAAELREIDGKAALCGLWAESARQSILSEGQGPRVLGSGSAYLDNKVIQRGLGFFNKVDPADSYAGAKGNCVVTDRVWQAGDDARALKLRLPRQVVHREFDDMGATAVEVLFRQTGPGA